MYIRNEFKIIEFPTWKKSLVVYTVKFTVYMQGWAMNWFCLLFSLIVNNIIIDNLFN